MRQSGETANYDAIVVGAGPGGSTAAYFLARAGAKVLVLERKSFPRPKVCGDGLTPRAVKVLEEIGMASELRAYQKVRGLRILGGGRTLEFDFPNLSEFCNYGLVRPRKDLDAEIAKSARAAGAEFWMGVEASRPIWDRARLAGVRWVRREKAEDGGVREVDEGDLRAPFTLIADGASSPFGRALGIERRNDYPLGLAIRTYYESPRANDDYFECWMDLRKNGELMAGYGWVFPVGDGTVNLGVGLVTTYGRWRDVNLTQLQRSFVEMLPKSHGVSHEGQTEKYQSGRLPMGGSVTKPYGDGFLIIGDAAGMVNPFNGEGIAYALETGKLAAGLISESLADGRTTEPADYRQALHDTYGAYYRMGRKFTKIIGNPRAFNALIGVGMRSKSLMAFAFQVLANLAEQRGGGVKDRVFRRLVRLAEHELEEVPEPRIPDPKTLGRRDSQKLDEALPNPVSRGSSRSGRSG